MSKTIVMQIQELRSMTVNKLQEKHQEVFGESTTARNKDYLWKRIAWKIQELEMGGLSERAKRRVNEIANEQDIRVRPPRGYFKECTPDKPKAGHHSLSPGTILTRDYKGEVLRVEVLDSGFRHNGQIYTSLSAVARKITGTNWNGNLFFKLKR